MVCERYLTAIQERADGTLGAIRLAELELHLEQCDGCRRLAEDFARIRELAGSLEHPAPPDRVWLQIAGRLRQAGRVAPPPPVAVASRRFARLALAASLLLVVGASLYTLYPRGGGTGDQPATGNSGAAEAVQGVEAEFRLAEQHYQNAIAKLQDAAKSDSGAIDAQTAATLQKNLEVIDRAIAESRSALKLEPQNRTALNNLFGLLKRKVMVLQDTIALMNQMRKGDAAGAVQVVDSVNKS